MQNFKETGFIKSYPALLKLPITISEKSFLELVLSFTDKGNTFYMNYNAIAPYLGFQNVQSVKNVAHSLRKKGYIATSQSHNFNGSTGGSSTSIVINEELINLQLKSIYNEEQESIRNVLSNSINVKSQISSSSAIIEENEDIDWKLLPKKIYHLSLESETIKKMLHNIIPQDDTYKNDDNFGKKFGDALKSIYFDVIMKDEYLKELYLNIQVEDE